MAKFVIECPNCGKYAEAKTGFFAKKKIDCTCGYTIDIRTDKLISRECPHCRNMVVFDQSKGEKAKCPVCREPINTMAEKNKVEEITCAQCGVKLMVNKAAETYTCPVCDYVNDVAERLAKEKISREGLISVIKYEGDGDTLIWKHPIEDFNYGSQLIVHESQEAIFFRDGQALDLFGAGRYTLETQQMPLLEKLYSLPAGGDTVFHSEVYYINLIHQMAIKWGTPEKINFIDPQTQAPIAIGARGLLNFRVANSRKLLLKLVGTGGKLTRQDLIENGAGVINNYFRGVIQLAVSTNLANIITGEKLDILQIDQQKLRLSAAMLPVIQPFFEDYGLAVTEFMVMGIVLPERGDLGYDALQTIISMRQKNLTKSAIETETEIKLAEMEAKKRLDIQLQQNEAEVEAAHRGLVQQKGETSILEAQLQGQRRVTEATGETAAERMRMELEMERKLREAQISAEEMRLKGYTQRDVLQADVQKAYAEGIGNMGPAISAGGGSSVMGDMLGLSMGVAAAGAIAPQIGGMIHDMTRPIRQMSPANASDAANSWDCTCGQKGITFNFCPNCGNKKPEPKPAEDSWDCECGNKGITFNFCPNCGKKRPEKPAEWDCPNCGMKKIAFNFCPNCGTKKPETPSTWDCSCGTQGITFNFCPNCGKKRGE